MSKTTNNIIRLIECGIDIIVEDCSGKTTANLIRMAQAAVQHDIHLTLRNCGNVTDNLIKVAEAGGSNVTIGV